MTEIVAFASDLAIHVGPKVVRMGDPMRFIVEVERLGALDTADKVVTGYVAAFNASGCRVDDLHRSSVPITSPFEDGAPLNTSELVAVANAVWKWAENTGKGSGPMSNSAPSTLA